VGAAIIIEPSLDRGRKRVAPDDLRRAVVTALSDRRFRENAKSTGERRARLGGAKAAADRIELLAQ
jgi:UDP:flavonoid glycosyltransferase YjiC (YdhE family)